MAILQNIADFNNNRSLSVLRNRLELDRLRKEKAAKGSYVNNKPLNEQEIALFNAIYKQYQQKIMEEAKVSSDEAEKLFFSCVEPYGKKNVVIKFAEPTIIRGVPPKWWLAEVIISLFAVIALQQHYDLSFSSCLLLYFVMYFGITFTGYLCYPKSMANAARQQKINAILNGGGIKFYGRLWLAKQ